MWKAFSNSEILKNVTQSLEKTGEAITQQAQTIARKQKENNQEDENQPLERLKQGWGNVVSATKQAMEDAKCAVEKEQLRLAARFQSPNQARRRDPTLPLDVEALQDAEVVYVTDRIITLSHPAMQSTVDGDITPARKLAAFGQLLHKRHGGRYMVWNLSEVEYDVSVLDDQVLLFSFPGSPSPPLGLLLKLLISMESWLKADDRNVAVVHCLTGKGRTSTVVAAFLCWMAEAGFTKDVHKALEYIARCKKISPEELTIPSQRRYAQYFANMLDGVRPSQPPLMLKRVILSEAPKFAKGPTRDDLAPPEDDTNYDPEQQLMGCAPYLQIFKAGQLVFTTAATLNYQQKKDELPFCQVADGTVSFHMDIVVQGDILLRCRHLTATGQRVSMFRAAFHTGYVPPNVMRLTKAQLDGACNDSRFADDFFLDLIFEPCDAETASKHLSGKADASAAATDDNSQNEAVDRRGRGTMAGADAEQQQQQEQQQLQTEGVNNPTVTASAYDSMLHRDSRFWDVIATRRQQHATAEQEKDELWGATIGRRREFDKKSENEKEDADKPLQRQNTFEAFSIGGAELDFAPPTIQEQQQQRPKERDELMEALEAIEDDTMSPVSSKKMKQQEGVEEIVFEAAETPPPAFKLEKDASTNPAESAVVKEEPEGNEKATEIVEKVEEKKDSTTSHEDGADEMTELLSHDLNLDDGVAALLDSAGDGTGDNVEDFDFDVDDEELEDLENFLTK